MCSCAIFFVWFHRQPLVAVLNHLHLKTRLFVQQLGCWCGKGSNFGLSIDLRGRPICDIQCLTDIDRRLTVQARAHGL